MLITTLTDTIYSHTYLFNKENYKKLVQQKQANNFLFYIPIRQFKVSFQDKFL